MRTRALEQDNVSPLGFPAHRQRVSLGFPSEAPLCLHSASSGRPVLLLSSCGADSRESRSTALPGLWRARPHRQE